MERNIIKTEFDANTMEVASKNVANICEAVKNVSVTIAAQAQATTSLANALLSMAEGYVMPSVNVEIKDSTIVLGDSVMTPAEGKSKKR